MCWIRSTLQRSSAGTQPQRNGLWYTKRYPESAWIHDWETLVERYKDDSTVVGVDLRSLDDLSPLGLGELEKAALSDQEGGLLLGPAHDPRCLFLGLLDDPFAFRVDPLGGPNLFGNRDPELIDEVEDRIAVDDRVPRQGKGLARGDQRLEPFEEEDDVQGSLRVGGLSARLWHAQLPHRDPSAARTASIAGGGIMPETSPPRAAISLTSDELT